MEAAVSPTTATLSVIATSPGFLAEETEDALARVLDVTSEETPVFGRLWCFWCSVSEGDLDLFRLESAASGMTEFSQRASSRDYLSCKKRNGWGERFGLEGGVDRMEKLWEVADVRRGIDGCWREDEIYGAHTLLGGGGEGDNDERDGGNVASESVKQGGER